MQRALALILVAACGGSAAPQVAPPRAPAPPRPPVLDDATWLQGGFSAERDDMHWRTVATALYGVLLGDDHYDVIIVDDSDDDGKPAPLAAQVIESGALDRALPVTEAVRGRLALGDGARLLTFAHNEHGFGAHIVDPPQPPVDLVFVANSAGRALDVDAADRAFAADSANRGAPAWVDAMAPGGALWRNNGRVERAAAAAAIGKTLAAGTLAWEPTASGVHGDLGYTVGTWVFAGGKARGSYCTIWQRQPGGAWKVLFDVGRTANVAP